MAQNSRWNRMKDSVKRHKKGIAIAGLFGIGTAELASYALTGRELFFENIILPRLYNLNLLPTREVIKEVIVEKTVTVTAPHIPSANVVYDLKSLLDAQQAVKSSTEFVMEHGRVYSSYVNSKAVQLLLQDHGIQYTGREGGMVEVLYNDAVNRIEARLSYSGGIKPISFERLIQIADLQDTYDMVKVIVKRLGEKIWETLVYG